MAHDPLTTITITLVGGLICQGLARRLQMPAIVPLLVAGVVMGPALGWVRPEDLGAGLKAIVGLAVAVILFEGGLSLKTEAFRFAGAAIRRLVLYGALITWGLCALAARLLFPELGWGLSLLFGSLVIVTGPTVILPLLKAVHPRRRVADILRGEAILIDPVGALYAVLVLEFLLEVGQESWGHVTTAFAQRIGLGVLIGIGGALILNILLRRLHDVAPDLKNRTVLVAAIGLYGLSEGLSEESGVLTVTLAGFVLGWLHPPGLEEVEEFKSHIVALLVSTVFILLAADLSLDQMMSLGWPGLVLVLLIIVVVRPATIFISTLGVDLSLREKLFLSWIAPRGIVAAAVSSLFALSLQNRGIAGGESVKALTFAVIVGTVLVQGPTAGWVGRMLRVLDSGRTGFLIVGGSRFGIALAKAIPKTERRVLLLDTNYGSVRKAREAGIPARRANALDEDTTEALDLDGIGNLIAVTPNDEVNRLAVRLYTSIFGERHCRAIAIAESPKPEKASRPVPYLFGQRLTLEALDTRLSEHWTIEEAAVDEDLAHGELDTMLDGAIPLVVFDRQGKVRFLADETTLKAGEHLLYLSPPSG